MADLILLKRSATAGSVPAPTQLATGELAVNTVDARIYVKRTNGTVSSIVADHLEYKASPSISSGTLALDLAVASAFDVALNASVTTLTISNPDQTAGIAISFRLSLTMDGTARTISWPASVKWPGGTPPTLTSANGKKDVFSFLSLDNGSTWIASTVGQNY